MERDRDMSDTPKKASHEDWHPADIKASLAKAGWSLNQLGLSKGYRTKSALARALHGPYPKAERIIAKAIGVKPETIWPSRYDKSGKPNRPMGRPPLRPAHATKRTTGTAGGNPQTRAAA
jgi:Ner family transcriptional regulator